MRKLLSVLAVSAAAGISAFGFAGCTTLLGTFDVSATADDGGGGGGDACTVCNGQCVDLSTNTLNCGACGIACLGGQICSDSKCTCQPDQAFCGGACQHADRQHCGQTCSQCQNDEICIAGCVPAPLASFDETPRDPTGWVDSGNKPLSFKIHDVGPGTTYECRTAPKGAFAGTPPPFANCDGGPGTGLVYTPQPDGVVPEGTYRTEMRYRNDTYRSDPVAFEFYVHHSLDHVPACPVGNDGPHFDDAAYFDAAKTYATAHGDFDVNTSFPAPGVAPTDPFYIKNPFIKIPFTGITHMPHLNPGPTDGTATWPATTYFDQTVVERSLRHTFVLNPTRTMILVKRQYQSPETWGNATGKRAGDCKNRYRIGSKFAAKTGPDGAGRGQRIMDCEALVLNPHGQGLCMGKNAAGNAPEPQVVDNEVNIGSGNYSGYTISATQGSATITESGIPSFSAWVNYYVQIPANKGHWYKITAVNSTSATITPAYIDATVTNSQFRYAPSGLQKKYVMPTGFAHLYQQSHVRAPPSLGTKCETLGCSDGKPWLTFLPP